MQASLGTSSGAAPKDSCSEGSGSLFLDSTDCLLQFNFLEFHLFGLGFLLFHMA